MGLQYTSATPAGSQSSSSNALAVLIHGGALSSSMYRTLVPLLTVPSIAIDLPGHGKSHDLGPFAFETSTKLIHALLSDLNSKASSATPPRILLIGISLGAQAVLHYLSQYPSTVSAAIVSGASIHPPDDTAAWEMPHMPNDPAWINAMMADIQIVGMDKAMDIRKESLAFTFEPKDGDGEGSSANYPPILVCVGEHDIAMAKRDFDELVRKTKAVNTKSEGRVLEGLWHNHSIDAPERFAAVIDEWVQKALPVGGSKEA